MHARLKVRDLSQAAAQPMAARDGRSRIVFNGELYDYDGIRSELERDGVTLRSRSDTEVLLEALQRWGIAALERLNGMFAFAWWDASRRALWLGRDRFGIKPLYWAATLGGVAAASELRALLAGGRVEARVDLAGIASYFAFGSVWGRHTAIAAVESLEPGTWLRVSASGIESRRYWRPRPHCVAVPRRQEDAIAEVRGLLRRSVESQLAADVPVGVFLSGGLDSGAILDHAARARRGQITGFTVAFPAAASRFDERREAARRAEHAGASHHVIELSPDACITELPRIASAIDSPSIDGVNSWFVSKAVRATGTVVALSGLGGDEVFCGYPHLRHARLYGGLARFLGRGRPFSRTRPTGWSRMTRTQKLVMAIASGGTVEGLYTTRRCLFMLPADLDLFRPELVDRWLAEQDRFVINALHRADGMLEQQTMLEFQNYLQNTLLRDTDCMSMAHALEVRVPFLDERVVEYVLALPAAWRVARGLQKPLLARAMGLLPARPSSKQGFTLPFVPWLRGPLAPLMEACLEELPNAGEYVDANGARSLWARFVAGDDRLWTRVWSLYVLDRWLAAIREPATPRVPDIVERRAIEDVA